MRVELLLACKSYTVPDAQDDALVVEACPQAMDVEPPASKPDPLDSGMVTRAVHQKKVRKIVTFGGTEIHEFIPLRSALIAEEQDNRDRRLDAVALRRDIGDLEAVIARMTVTHQSQMSNLRCNLEDTALFDEAKRFARRTGFGVVVVSCNGSLLGYGAGEPPSWIVDAAGAEVWAYYSVLALNPSIPDIVTDCKGILDGLRSDPFYTTGPKKALARTWQHIRNVLDDDFTLARTRLCWMPSHRCASKLKGITGSDGLPVTTLMWRANRLADALAKGIASQHRLPQWALALVKTTGKLIKHQAARIGVATYLANNYEEQVTLEGGATATRFRRDSTAARPHFQRKGKPATVQQSASHQAAANTGFRASAGTSFAAATSMPNTPHRRGKRAATLAACELRRLADQEAALARCLSAKRLRPSTGPGATERLAAVRDKVLARSCRG